MSPACDGHAEALPRAQGDAHVHKAPASTPARTRTHVVREGIWGEDDLAGIADLTPTLRPDPRPARLSGGWVARIGSLPTHPRGNPS